MAGYEKCIHCFGGETWDHFEDLGLYGRILLKWIIWEDGIWIHDLRTGTSEVECCCESSDKRLRVP
jgi:hypothetical protein